MRGETSANEVEDEEVEEKNDEDITEEQEDTPEQSMTQRRQIQTFLSSTGSAYSRGVSLQSEIDASDSMFSEDEGRGAGIDRTLFSD